MFAIFTDYNQKGQTYWVNVDKINVVQQVNMRFYGTQRPGSSAVDEGTPVMVWKLQMDGGFELLVNEDPTQYIGVHDGTVVEG